MSAADEDLLRRLLCLYPRAFLRDLVSLAEECERRAPDAKRTLRLEVVFRQDGKVEETWVPRRRDWS